MRVYLSIIDEAASCKMVSKLFGIQKKINRKYKRGYFILFHFPGIFFTVIVHFRKPKQIAPTSPAFNTNQQKSFSTESS